MKQAAWNVIGSVVQKFIEGKIAELFITKTVETGKTAATIEGEAARTSATQAGVLARIASTGLEIISSLAGAAASIVAAISNAIRWVFTTIPFPLSLGMAGGAVAAIGGLYSGIKSAFGFKEGGVFKKGQRGFIEGTKTEIIQPEETFISYLNKKIIPTIVNTTRIITMQQPQLAYAGGGSDALLREMQELKTVLKRKDFKIGISGTLNGQRFARDENPKAERFRKSITK
jgi:gamma-glutamyl:cysteine ligase YbdK (ATP-grasp superfamily)